MVQQWCDQTLLSINPQEIVTEDRFKGPKETRHTHQLTTDVNNLGLILDEGLTWKGQLKNVVKAYRAFRTHKGTFSKTWGLKPRVVHWTYITMIRPVLTYDPKVWWQRIRYISRTELIRLQRLANRDDDQNPNSCNGDPSGNSSSTCGD
jgi:hypothetical protein